MNALIVDDEQHCIDGLKYELDLWCPSITVVGESKSGIKGIELLNSLKPNILFLDIEMPGMSGFDLLDHTNTVELDVVFVTAYDQYAIKAFKYSAADYLMKPVQGKILKDTIDRISINREIRNNTALLTLKHLLQNKNHDRRKLPLNVGNDIIFVNEDEIIRCKADGNFTHVFLLNDKKYYVSKSIKQLSALLEGQTFLKCHQSHLINRNHILTYSKSEGGFLTMVDKARVPISRGKRSSILSQLL